MHTKALSNGEDIALSELIDAQPLGSFRIKAVTLCFLVICLCGFDATLIGVIAPSLVQGGHLDRYTLGSVVSAALLGIAHGTIQRRPIANIRRQR